MNTAEHRNEVLEQAIEYLNRGFSVIPTGRDKKPLLSSWAEYQTRKPTEEEVRDWWFKYEPAGVAIITGKISGIVALDVEKGGDTTQLNIPLTPTVKTGGDGRHYYFKYPGQLTQNSVRFKELMDIRGDGGYIITAPSLHKSGNKYEWIHDLNTPLADMPEWMKTKVENSNNNTETKVKIKSVWDDIMYGVSEGERHNSALRIVGKLLAHIPAKDHDSIVLPLLEAWNQRNTPPLPDKELWRVYDDIYEKHSKGEVIEKPAQYERKLLSVTDVLNYVPTTQPFLIDQLLPHRGITALSGHPNAGKSWVMLKIAESVANGTPLFGKYPSIKGNVLIVDEEGGIDEMWKRVRMLSFSKDLNIFFSILSCYKLDNEKDLSQLLSIVKEKDISLVIFDPYVSMHSKSENSAEETAEVMSALQKFNDVGAAVLFIHHQRKDSIVKFGYAQSLRGSSALLGRLDSLIVVKKISSDDVSDEVQILHEKSRRGKKVPAFQFSLMEENEKMVVTNITEMKPEKLKIEQAKETIVGLFDVDTELTRKDIITSVKKEAGIGEKNIAEGIRELAKEKLLVEIQVGKEKHYKLTIKEQGQ
jgi:hypothetical protein